MSATARLDLDRDLDLDHVALPVAVPSERRRATPLAIAARVAMTSFLLVAAFLVAGAAGLGLYSVSHAERIYEGVEVAGARVGGMTETQARAALETRFAEYAAQPLTLVAGDQTFAVTPAEAGAVLDGAASADAAYQYGRSGSLWDRSLAWGRGLFGDVDIAPRVDVDLERLDAQLRAVAPSIVRAPANAYVDMGAAAGPTLVPEQPGVALDMTSSRAALIARMQVLASDPVTLATRPAPAAVTADALAANLPRAVAAVDAPLVLSTLEGTWTVSPTDLRRIVSVRPEQAGIVVDREPVRSLVAGLAAGIDRASADAGLTVDETGAFAVVPQVDAATVDVEATTDAILAALSAGSHEVDFAVDRAPPAITDAQAAAAAQDAENLIANGLMLTWEGGAARLGRDDLLRALTITPLPGDATPFQFDLDRAVLAELVAPVADQLFEPAVDARFRIADGKIAVVGEAKTGREIDPVATVERAAQAVMDGKRELKLEVKPVAPDYTAADLDGITLGDDILGDASTWYAGSSEPRRNNVELASNLENGWLVPPGGVFSYVENIGAVDKEQGFATGFGIVANEGGGVTTAPVIGGGICQVSTTIFQAAFWAGLPIEERYQHPYWLTGYGHPPRGMLGLDAMVNIEDDWALDLKFRNATDHWLAVLVVADGQTVTTKIVGTDPGWDVAVGEPRVTNIVPANTTMIYTDSPELPQGQNLQVETAQDGFDVAIERTVTKDGEVVDQETIESSFAPARNMTLRGTGVPQ